MGVQFKSPTHKGREDHLRKLREGFSLLDAITLATSAPIMVKNFKGADHGSEKIQTCA